MTARFFSDYYCMWVMEKLSLSVLAGPRCQGVILSQSIDSGKPLLGDPLFYCFDNLLSIKSFERATFFKPSIDYEFYSRAPVFSLTPYDWLKADIEARLHQTSFNWSGFIWENWAVGLLWLSLNVFYDIGCFCRSYSRRLVRLWLFNVINFAVCTN